MAARAPATGAKTLVAPPVLGTAEAAEAAATATPLEAPVVLLAALARARDRVVEAPAAVVAAPVTAEAPEEAAVPSVAVLTAVVTYAGIDLQESRREKYLCQPLAHRRAGQATKRDGNVRSTVLNSEELG